MATLSITLSIPDDQASRLQAALAARGTTPRLLLIAQLIQLVHQYEADEALKGLGTLDVA